MPLKVLLVEDHPVVAQTTIPLLEECGYEVTYASNGKDAIELARSTLPEVILLDIGLPDICGYDVAQMFRSIPELSRALIVALSGYDQAEKALAAGCSHHFTKPMTDFCILKELYRRSQAVA